MTREKLLEAIELYRKLFIECRFQKSEHLHDELLTSDKAGFGHCYGLLDHIIKLVHENQLEEAYRLLGLIQGFLWSRRIFTWNELEGHIRNKDPFDL